MFDHFNVSISNFIPIGVGGVKCYNIFIFKMLDMCFIILYLKYIITDDAENITNKLRGP